MRETMFERPRYRKWRRRIGGRKVCAACGHQHKPAERVEGRIVRPRACLKCGAELPTKLTYPKKSEVRWVVREFDPRTGYQMDTVCKSSELADEFIRLRERDWTPDQVQTRLLEEASVLIRGINASSRDDAVNTLIAKLGGDASSRKVKAVGWSEAVDVIGDEMRQKGQSIAYVAELKRITSDLAIITGLTEWPAVDLDAIAKFRKARLDGGWERGGHKVKAVGGWTLNKELATLGAFFSRAVRKNWMKANPLTGASDERVKVQKPRVEYMPDEDLRKLIESADTTWMKSLILVAYYTGARRNDLLNLEWDRDLDFEGTKVASDGRKGPHIWIRSHKADTPHWMPLHPAAVIQLKVLRQLPVISRQVFPVKSSSPGPRVTGMFSDLVMKAGLTREVEQGEKTIEVNRWSLHDLRRKANTDLRNRGASPKERMTLLGHKTQSVNEDHYEASLPSSERELIDALPAFGMVG